MQQALRKFISVLLITIFFLGSGGGQVIHGIFHNHSFANPYQTSTTVSLPHSYCTALQLTLPQFYGSNNINLPGQFTQHQVFFSYIKCGILLIYAFKTSDRAPPVLA